MGLFLSRMYDVFGSFSTGKPARILMLGLDAAGKTTILYKVKLNENLQTIPTIGFNVEQVSPCRGVSFTVWDVGGQEKIRRLWQHYYQGADGLIFVVDSNDHERMDEAREELHGILSSYDMSRIPIVIIANKQDLPNAMKPADIIQKLGVNELRAKNKWFLQPACAVTGEGLLEAMIEMSNLVKQHRKEND
ncbi:unnamed protein product [Rotaria socialis]|uniref:ADP-ribosylation factor n=1 Tax=Rotaria socialis TaxID=392032 RepID=A0A821KYN4_9BILA|nr:unnamed protein product [Rotaria socialis]CAF3402145.1 unnamed protein product [Rotaria socialis]CAF3443165.1 unnamed protein product [Rotaria socialis]CAF3537576.1 unnamed protein product [Rotaria socialis]CAF3544014.1 unnamed protein product [Rotaria socialis]